MDEWLKLYDVPWVDNLIASCLVWLPDVEAGPARYCPPRHGAAQTRPRPGCPAPSPSE